MAVAVVTDSTSDLEPALAERYGIDVVPLFVNFGDERFRDGIDLSRDEFYRRMREGNVLPTTSQPTAAMFEAVYRPHVEAGESIVSVHITQTLSGTINAARAGAEQFSGATIRLVDSMTVTGGCALLAMHAAELARDGLEADEIVATLERERTVTKGYAAVPDLSHAVRTGRISRTQAAIGGLLKIVPLLSIGDGKVDVIARVRTFSRAQEMIIDSTLGNLGEAAKARIVVMHAHAPENGQGLLEQLRARLFAEPAYLGVTEAGPAIATHAGPGAIGIFSLAG